MQALLLAVLAWSVLAAWAPRFWAVSIPQICIFIGVAAFALRGRLRFSPLLLIPGALAAIGAMQWIAGSTVYRVRTADSALDWAGYTAFALLAIQPDIGRERLMRNLLYGAGALAALCAATAFTSPFHIFWVVPVRFEQVFGPYVYRNYLAAFAELCFPVALWLASVDRERRSIFLTIAAALVSTVVIAQSRTGLILLGVEAIAFLIWASQRWLTILVTTALLSAVLVTGVSGIGNRFAEEHPYRVRLEILRSTIDMAAARPVTGWGLGNFRTVYPAYGRIDPGVLVNEAHNDWAQWPAEGGVVALVAMAAMFVWSVRIGLRTGWALGIAAVFVHAFVDYPFEEPSVVLLLMLLAGLATRDGGLVENPQSHRRIARRRSRPTVPESVPVWDERVAHATHPR